MIFIRKNQSRSAKVKIAKFKKLSKKDGVEPNYSRFSNDLGKKEVHESLLIEQGYICAYCMQRIGETATI